MLAKAAGITEAIVGYCAWMTSAPKLALDSVSCESCGAALSVAKTERTARCPYCASPNIVSRPRTETPDPEFVVAFVITRDEALRRARAWIRSTWFVRSAFAKADVTDTRGVYLPAYLYTASASADYTASIGENYTVVETYTTTDSNGKTVTRTRTKTVTEWRSLSGTWAAYLEDIVVTASKGLHNDELEAVEPFDMRALRRYTPKVLSGWLAEDPSRTPTECSALIQQEASAQIGTRVRAHMPGDSVRELHFQPTLSHQHSSLVLLPVWVLAVKYDPERPAVRMVLNGQTGKLIGAPPRSWAKITLAIVGGIALVAAIGVLLSQGGM